jgi:release factor glutamine methyltransferase
MNQIKQADAEQWTVTEAKAWALPQLEGVSDQACFEADLLCAHVLECDRAQILTDIDQWLTQQQRCVFESLVRRRAQGEPIAYLIGQWGFWEDDFYVTPDTLVPRPDTECLVEAVLTRWQALRSLKVLELGVGSGAIAVTLGKYQPGWNIVATDICEKALSVAQENARRLGTVSIQWKLGDWYDAIDADQQFDLIISNPPYIEEGADALQDVGVKYEPRQALVSGKEGLDALTVIIEKAHQYLNPGGSLLLESAPFQINKIAELMAQSNLVYQGVEQDLSGHDRVSIGQYLG